MRPLSSALVRVLFVTTNYLRASRDCMRARGVSKCVGKCQRAILSLLREFRYFRRRRSKVY